MDGVDRLRRRRTLQERLGVGLVCCGSTWDIEPSTMSVRGDDDDDDDDASEGGDLVEPQNQLTDEIQTPPEPNSNPHCVLPPPRMSLAAVLEAERYSRTTAVAADGVEVGLVCCGSTWDIEPSTMSVRGDGDDEVSDGDDLVDPLNQLTDDIQTPPELNSNPDSVLPSPRMSLAAVLEAERHSRTTDVATDGGDSLTPSSDNDVSLTTTHQETTPATPARVSLMRLLEETDDQDEKEGGGMDLVCCVCMRRKKGAAFIPCGHTFCRVCSRELWLNRGLCPLCNRSILEILDIY